jgi:tetratricopeptide (TPR) repeat protein/CHAT domain-containing protein
MAAGMVALALAVGLVPAAAQRASKSVPAVAQSDDAAALRARVVELYRAGKYAEAIPLAQRRLAILDKVLGPNHPDVAASLNDLAVLYGAQGRYADAEPLYKRSLAIREKVLGPDHPDVATALTNLATLYWNLGRYDDAERLDKRSLAILEKALGSDHPDVAASLNDLAVLYSAQGRYADALPLLKRSLAIREKALGTDHPDVAASLNDLALLYDHQGRYADALPLLKRALAIREKALGIDHPDVAASLNNLAGLYKDQGRYADAEPLFRRSLAIREKLLGPDHPEVATSLNNLANVYLHQARYADAEPLYKRSLAIREKTFGPDHLDVGHSLNDLAGLYDDLGRLAEAEPLHKRALAIVEKALGPEHPDLAIMLNNLAASYSSQGRYADAEPIYRRSLAIREKALGPDHPDVAISLNNLADLYAYQRRYAEAEPLYERSLAIWEKALGPDHPLVATSLHHLAVPYQNEGRYADAEPLYKRSLAIREKALGPDHPDVALSLNDLAALYLAQGRYADALPVAQRVILNGRAHPSIALPVLVGAQLTKLISPEKALDEALTVVQRAAQTLAASAIGKLAVRLAAGTDHLAQLVRQDQDLAAEADTLDKAIIAAVSKPPAQRDAAAEQQIRARSTAIAGQRDTLQKTFAKEFPDYAALSNPPPMTAREIQALLSDDEALVFFAAAGDQESYVFALTRGGFDWKPIPLGGEALAAKVAAFRRGLDVDMVADTPVLAASGIKRELFDLGLASDLYTSLLGPVEPLIKGKRQLLVVPFGPLTALPFHLLVTEKPAVSTPSITGKVTAETMAPYREAAWLMKRQAVSVMPSVANLKTLRLVGHKEQALKPLIGFGNPVFNADAAAASQRGTTKTTARSLATRSFSDFWQGAGVDRSLLGQALPQLPDTADELKAVALEVGASSADIHLGRDASETNVKHAPLANYRIVYFATHGLVAGDIKGLAEPSLALTIPPQSSVEDDGLLTASEVALLKLNADWVVLSACNTIAGDRPGAEALSGLARAFFYAGARALLVSHWSVASDAATRLTTATFDILKADPKLGRAEAVRRAMLAYINDQAQPRNAYPAIWGPFSIIGEGAATR